MNMTVMKSSVAIDWRWVGLGFCFFVVFHMMPLYLFGWAFESSDDGANSWVLWACIYMGLGLVSSYIGFRSRGVTIAEPVIAGLLYIVALFNAIPQIHPLSTDRGWPAVLISLLAAFVVCSVSAYVGEIIQQKRLPENVEVRAS